MPRPLRLRGLLPAVLLGGSLVGCGRDVELDADPGSAARPGPALSARIDQADPARRLLRVVLRNDGLGPVAVRTLQLRGGGFVQVPPTTPVAGGAAAPVDSGPDGTVAAAGELAAGRDLVATLAYGPVLCEGLPAPVAVVVETGTGPVDAAVPDEQLLPALRAQECGR